MNPTILPPAMGKAYWAISLGEGKLWLQISCRPGEGWATPDYSCPRYVARVEQPNQFMGPVSQRYLF